MTFPEVFRNLSAGLNQYNYKCLMQYYNQVWQKNSVQYWVIIYRQLWLTTIEQVCVTGSEWHKRIDTYGNL